MDKLSERIEALEIIVAEQQQMIDDLNEMITKQWNENDRLKHDLAQVSDQLEELAENQQAPAVQKAPHY